MKRFLALAVFVMFVLAAPVMASIDEGDGEVGFDFGTTEFDDDTGLDSGERLGLRGGYMFNRMFELEGQFASTDDQNDFLGIDVDTNVRLLMVNGVFNFHPTDAVVPYVMAGIGRAEVEVETLGITVDDDSVAYQVGGGSRFFFGSTKRAAFRFDVSLLQEDTFNDSSTHTSVTGGFTFRLGAAR